MRLCKEQIVSEVQRSQLHYVVKSLFLSYNQHDRNQSNTAIELVALSWSQGCLSGKDYHLFISSSSHHDVSLCIISSSIMYHHHWAHWASRRCEKFLRSCEGGRCCVQPGILHFGYNAIMLDITTTNYEWPDEQQRFLQFEGFKLRADVVLHILNILLLFLSFAHP